MARCKSLVQRCGSVMVTFTYSRSLLVQKSSKLQGETICLPFLCLEEGNSIILWTHFIIAVFEEAIVPVRSIRLYAANRMKPLGGKRVEVGNHPRYSLQNTVFKKVLHQI